MAAQLPHFVTYFLIALITPVIVRWVIRGAKRERATPDESGTHHVMRPGKAHRSILIVCGVLFIVVGVVTVVTSQPYWKIGAIFGPVFAIPGVLALYALRRSVTLSPEGIRSSSPWTGERVASWKDIEAVRFREWGQTIRLRIAGRERIVVPCYLSGVEDLERSMQAHLSSDVIGSTFQDFKAYVAAL